MVCFGLFCIWGQFPNISPQEFIFGGLIIGGFFPFRFWVVIFGGAYFRICFVISYLLLLSQLKLNYSSLRRVTNQKIFKAYHSFGFTEIRNLLKTLTSIFSRFRNSDQFFSMYYLTIFQTVSGFILWAVTSGLKKGCSTFQCRCLLQ